MAECDGSCTPTTRSLRRLRRFQAALAEDSVPKRTLVDLAWSGVPEGLSRCEVWQLLLDYRPLSRERRVHKLQCKRGEYLELRHSLYECAVEAIALEMAGESAARHLSPEALLLRQIRKDLPRTQVYLGCGEAAQQRATDRVVGSPAVQGLMERVLFVWALRSPASGYVQGIDGILLLLVLVALADRGTCAAWCLGHEVLERLDDAQLGEVEADCYWCLTKILSFLHDHYTDGFPGIQRTAKRLMELIWRIDPPLGEHLSTQSVDIFDTLLRWVGCLMVRELPVASCARLWDALIAESAQAPGSDAGFETLLLYFCVSFMARFSTRLQSMDFEAITMFFKNAPTESVSEDDVDVLLGEAFVLKSLFQHSPNHLTARPD